MNTGLLAALVLLSIAHLVILLRLLAVTKDIRAWFLIIHGSIWAFVSLFRSTLNWGFLQKHLLIQRIPAPSLAEVRPENLKKIGRNFIKCRYVFRFGAQCQLYKSIHSLCLFYRAVQ